MKNLLLVPFLSRRRNYDTCIISIIICTITIRRQVQQHSRCVAILLNDCEVNEVVAEEQ